MAPSSTEIRTEIQKQAQAHYRGLEFTYQDFEATLNAVSDLNEIRTTDDSCSYSAAMPTTQTTDSRTSEINSTTALTHEQSS